MLELLNEKAYQFGYTYEDAYIEAKSNNNQWSRVSHSEDALPYGVYRLKYEIRDKK